MISQAPQVARPNDAAGIHALERRCFGPVDVFSLRRWRRLLQSPTVTGLVIHGRKGEILAGVFGLLRHFRVPSGRVYKIAIDPSLQGQGIGTCLLRLIEERFRRAGMSRSCAEVRAGNIRSRGMFLKNGYEEAGVLPGYYDDGEDGIKLWKDLISDRRRERGGSVHAPRRSGSTAPEPRPDRRN